MKLKWWYHLLTIIVVLMLDHKQNWRHNVLWCHNLFVVLYVAIEAGVTEYRPVNNAQRLAHFITKCWFCSKYINDFWLCAIPIPMFVWSKQPFGCTVDTHCKVNYQAVSIFSEPVIHRLHTFPGNTRSVIQQVAGIILFRSNK